jgi:uncharacterized protein (TIGR00645 family)
MAKEPGKLEQIFELILWKSRLIILLAVIFGVLAAVLLFCAGSYEIFTSMLHVLPETGHELNYNKLLIDIIGAIDMYLIGIVLIIFSFGIYELFISRIDIARHDKDINILEIHSLDELKNKILKVIVMVLIVSFFKSILTTSFNTPLEMLCLAGAILAIGTCAFLIRNIDKEADEPKPPDHK